jgi:heme-degrading monooxygenase HmoA
MIAVIFEVIPTDDQRDEYLAIAQRIMPDLEKVDGFISVERFQSLADKRKLLSLSFFRDEAAVIRWRQAMVHKDAQQHGRSGLFESYRIRVAAVMRDYGLTDRSEAPEPVGEPGG